MASKCRSTCQPSGVILFTTRSNTLLSGTSPRWRTKFEAAAAKAALMQLAQPGLRDGVVDIGDGAIGAAACSDGVERDTIVGAVYAGIDDHGAAYVELRMQLVKIIQPRIRRRVRTIGR